MSVPVPSPVEVQTPSETLPPSLVRTLFPFLAGLLGTWVVERLGVEVDTATVGALLTAGIGYLYYVIARFAEVFVSEKWGYVLGFRKTPVYATPPLPSTVIAAEDGRVDPGFVGVVLLVVGVIGLVVTLIADRPVGVVISGVVLLVGAVLALTRR